MWNSAEIKIECTRAMNEDLIARHNRLVQPNDLVYHLGDFAFAESRDVAKFISRMNGNFRFIWGNHDAGLKELKFNLSHYPDLKDRVKFLGDLAEDNIEGHKIILCHYAMLRWNNSHFGSYHLFGHSHNTLPDDPNSLSFDVGVDCNNYEPFSLEQVVARMANKTFKPIDQHGHRS